MLYITVELEEVKEKVRAVSDYFNATYESNWFNNQLAKDIIKGIDSSVHVKDNLIESPILGGISPRELSTGCKGCLLLLNTDEDLILSGERFGDNCFYWLGKIGEVRDIKITIHHYIRKYSKNIPVTACITNTGKLVYNLYDLAEEILRVGTEEGYGNVR